MGDWDHFDGTPEQKRDLEEKGYFTVSPTRRSIMRKWHDTRRKEDELAGEQAVRKSLEQFKSKERLRQLIADAGFRQELADAIIEAIVAHSR